MQRGSAASARWPVEPPSQDQAEMDGSEEFKKLPCRHLVFSNVKAPLAAPSLAGGKEKTKGHWWQCKRMMLVYNGGSDATRSVHPSISS